MRLVGVLILVFLFADANAVEIIPNVNVAWTSAEWMTVFGAFGVLVASIGGVIINVFVSIRNGQKTDRVINEVVAGNAQTVGLSHQVQEVHTLTNSNLSAVKAELATASAQIAQLHDVVADLKIERGKVAAAAALRGRALAVAVAPIVGGVAVGTSPAAEQSLAAIDANTAAIDENTRHTSDRVDALEDAAPAAAAAEDETARLRRELAELRAQIADGKKPKGAIE